MKTILQLRDRMASPPQSRTSLSGNLSLDGGIRDQFSAFEHSGWQSIPNEYHRAFSELTTQAIGPLLDAVCAVEGMKLLDIASGPGYVTGAAAKRGVAVLGIDFSSAMVAEAKRRYPNVEFREGNAEHLPFGDGVFDAAVMNFGMLHLGDPDRALSESYRVLRAGGRFAFTVWAKPEETIAFGIVLRAIEAHGNMSVDLPQGPPFFRFSDAEECVRSLCAAGFDTPEVVKVPQTWRLPGEDGLFNAMKDSTVRTAGLLRAQEPTAIAYIREAIRAESKNYRNGDVLELPMPAILASAGKS